MGTHDGHRQRMKTEFLARPDSFPDHKVLELLLFYANPRSDTNPLAHELMEHFGSLAGVLDATPEELQKVKGVGEHATVLFKVVKELAGRYLTVRTQVDDIAQSSKDYYALLRPYFFGARNERLCLLCLDGKHKVLGVRRLGEGNVNAVTVTTRLIAEAALSLNAAGVVLAHNHVSGLAFPSPEDLATTQSLASILSTMSITLVDHLIFVDDDMVSLRDSGYYQP
ncbi:JAB domain-containing protein [Pseudoflavonifractor phocaeensis]|uniref:JAB domain-containing protein n=1 Tax=Pseudoflavonifractor phocaeensis TaxID=1870988 RepID=UPI00195BFA25|nr:DNA repair protein RadC [Pseudoflavonifractor phocaeensis]MBM6884288.1 DNA repair protein RadC [Pseudoflavonifractor phocaeensis]